MWHDTTVLLPADAQAVYIRRLLYGGQTPVSAIYRAASVSFEVPTGELLAWYFVGVWRAA